MNRPTVMQGIVENRTGVKITEVKVFHLPTRIGAELSVIQPDRIAAVGFQPKALEADEAVLSWFESGLKHVARLKLPASARKGETGLSVLIYRIFPNGHATVEVTPVEMSK